MPITSVVQNTSTYEVTYADGHTVWVPLAPENADYQDVQKWVAGGGVITE